MLQLYKFTDVKEKKKRSPHLQCFKKSQEKKGNKFSSLAFELPLKKKIEEEKEEKEADKCANSAPRNVSR